MIQPLTLGNKKFPTNLIQGPLAGISCAPFRLLTWQYSKPAFSCTEMHGRHWTEHYETPCNLEQIKFFVDAMNIPVIGNGDVSDSHSLKKIFATGCAGVMISRAGVGQPWLIAELTAKMQGQDFSLPSRKEISNAFLQHVTHLAQLLAVER